VRGRLGVGQAEQRVANVWRGGGSSRICAHGAPEGAGYACFV